MQTHLLICYSSLSAIWCQTRFPSTSPKKLFPLHTLWVWHKEGAIRRMSKWICNLLDFLREGYEYLEENTGSFHTCMMMFYVGLLRRNPEHLPRTMADSEEYEIARENQFSWWSWVKVNIKSKKHKKFKKIIECLCNLRGFRPCAITFGKVLQFRNERFVKCLWTK